jgi:hypothetical protein
VNVKQTKTQTNPDSYRDRQQTVFASVCLSRRVAISYRKSADKKEKIKGGDCHAGLSDLLAKTKNSQCLSQRQRDPDLSGGRFL